MEKKIVDVNVCECNGDVEKNKKQQKSTAPVTVVLKIDLHCDGCISRIVNIARHLEGVETVRADTASNKLTLVGFMDPVKIAEKLQKKSKKKVELISPKPKKETKDNNEKKADNKTTTTMIAVSTVVLKLNCSCDGCIKRIYKTVSKTKGVYQVKMDKEKEVVTVTGTMDVKSVTENLKRKLKKSVQIVPEKKKKDKDKDKDKAEGITKVGSPGLPDYGFNPGFGPSSCGFFSDEDPNACRVM